MMENIKEDMILQKIRFDSYTNYVTEVMQKGTPNYIASVAEELRTGAGDLKICEIVSMTNPFEVTFKPSDMKEIITSGTSIIGEINISQHPIFGEFDIYDAFLLTSSQLWTHQVVHSLWISEFQDSCEWWEAHIGELLAIWHAWYKAIYHKTEQFNSIQGQLYLIKCLAVI